MKRTVVALAAMLTLAACSEKQENTEINTEEVPAAVEPAPVVVDTTGAAPSPHDTMSGMQDTAAAPQ